MVALYKSDGNHHNTCMQSTIYFNKKNKIRILNMTNTDNNNRALVSIETHLIHIVNILSIL